MLLTCSIYRVQILPALQAFAQVSKLFAKTLISTNTSTSMHQLQDHAVQSVFGSALELYLPKCWIISRKVNIGYLRIFSALLSTPHPSAQVIYSGYCTMITYISCTYIKLLCWPQTAKIAKSQKSATFSLHVVCDKHTRYPNGYKYYICIYQK